MQKIRIIKKNNEYSMEYNVGDTFTVDSTWYGGVNVTSRTGIPLSLDKDEYEEIKDSSMRRSDREVKSFEEIVAIMEQCDVCRLAFHDGEYPYILPLNFGMQVENGRVTLYFHGAGEGKKHTLLARNHKVCFEMDCAHRLVLIEDEGNCTMEYESVVGYGTVENVPDEDKMEALRILMKHYRREDFPFNEAVVPRTSVWKLTVSSMTGKRRMKR